MSSEFYKHLSAGVETMEKSVVQIEAHPITPNSFRLLTWAEWGAQSLQMRQDSLISVEVREEAAGRGSECSQVQDKTAVGSFERGDWGDEGRS